MAEINAIRTMEARDVLSAKLATATVTVDGNRYLLFQAKNIEAKFTKSKKEVPILGRIMRGLYAASFSLLCDAAAYPVINSSVFLPNS